MAAGQRPHTLQRLADLRCARYDSCSTGEGEIDIFPIALMVSKKVFHED